MEIFVNTINEKLQKLDDLYQKLVNRNQKLTEKISQYEKLEREKIKLDISLQWDRMLYPCLLLVFLDVIFVVIVSSNPIIQILGFVLIGFGGVGTIAFLETIGILKK